MSNILYLECNSGISGDMTVAALLDLGASEEVLMKALDSIPADGFSVEVTRVKKTGIDCCDFAVFLDAEHENHDHDMEYLHGHPHEHLHVEGHEHPHEHPHGEGHEHLHEHYHGGEHEHIHEHYHGEEHEHIHEHHHGEEHEHHHGEGQGHSHEHPHGHVHRGMKEIREIIAVVKMTDHARKLALRIFEIIAEAEAKAHAVPVEQVHFHEVGAIDSIVDVVAAAVCLDDLHIESVVVPKLCEGTGTVRCQHGVLPVPVPAVTNIVEKNGLNLEIMDVQGEFVTPTGAAIAAAVKTSDVLPKAFRIVRTGIGAGKRTYERPSILRAMLIEPAKTEEKGDKDCIYRMETNIDDCSGEVLGYVMDLLFEAGARDVHYHPVYMKKNRPAWQLNVICDEADIARMEEIIFRETTTIGIRRVKMERTVLSRESRDVKVGSGRVQVKVCHYGSESKFYPEYESVKELCRTTGRSYRDIYQEAVAACRLTMETGRVM
ncbi:TIGR00299 family protein [Eubacterium sp. An11]|uniref:nickel pincer cofactor biosynthesis protein LarC n=1 Tax=Eubacterium sp. An11 TaxID=1965542 RepID=UPI000B380FC1|nr:nickel pincer cofactor biosynthesis protein LarC [Eubacterium sp. An11]OUQ65637.1 TIGR00299 family protein [Eubacterium sp. An11]